MIEQIIIDKKSYYVNFGTWCTRQFEEDTGINVNDISFKGSQTGNMLDMMWHGLKDGARIKEQEFTLSKVELSDLLDLDGENAKKSGDIPAAVHLANAWLRANDMPELGQEEEEKKKQGQ